MFLFFYLINLLYQEGHYTGALHTKKVYVFLQFDQPGGTHLDGFFYIIIGLTGYESHYRLLVPNTGWS
jgi:hypothetical protein